MNTTYYIYEVPTEKNGATHEWEERRSYNFNQYQIEPIIVETIEGPDNEDMWQIVGDREWYYADLNGYERGTHYRAMRLKGIKGGLKGGPIAGQIALDTGQWASLKTFKHQQTAGSRGGKIGGAIVGKIKANQLYTCDCGRTIKGPSFFRHQKACKA
jgi:hypothetical protein